jgi:hypothetical protein
MTSYRHFVLPLLLLLVAKAASAQTVALAGHVTDPDRAAVVGVLVTATPVPAGTAFTTRTQPDGTFRFAALPAGRYQLEIAAPGFAAWAEDVTPPRAPAPSTRRCRWPP